jgi:two-component system, NarL family, sensor histidine kinase BarA
MHTALLKRIRQLRISLAAKCQILFGLAVVLIIAAALFVPWQRMEQLTDQLDLSAAAALADQALERHVWKHETGPSDPNASRIVSAAATSPSAPTDEPNAAQPEPRLIAANRPLKKETLPAFDYVALRHFGRKPDSPYYSRYIARPDGSERFEFAQPLRLEERCAKCHVALENGHNILVQLGDTSPVVPDKPNGAFPPPLIGLALVEMPSRIDADQLMLNRVFLFIAGLLAGTLAVVTFYVITTRLILKPVRVLQETAEKVSQGDLNIRSDISTGDEFQQLSETFNTMLVNLKRNADQLRSINKSLDLKLGQLAESNLVLYESNRLKSEFLANVSHELRTPLNSILGFADLLKDALSRGVPPEPPRPTILAADGKLAPMPAAPAPPAANGNGGNNAPADAKTLRYVSNILQSGRSLLDLINELLDLAKIEAGKMEIRSEPLVIGDLFEGLINILRPLSEQKNLTVHPSVAPDVPIIQSDPGKLQQVLYNFLSNAIKFSHDGGRIELTAMRDGSEHVRIIVTDHGAGIPPEKQALIFEKFRQIDGSVTRSHSGTGLGLAISRELAHLLSGSIGVRSAPNEGSSFWITVPLRIQPGEMEVRGKLVMS